MNEFSGIIPSQIGALSNLETLSLYNNEKMINLISANHVKLYNSIHEIILDSDRDEIEGANSITTFICAQLLFSYMLNTNIKFYTYKYDGFIHPCLNIKQEFGLFKDNFINNSYGILIGLKSHVMCFFDYQRKYNLIH